MTIPIVLRILFGLLALVAILGILGVRILARNRRKLAAEGALARGGITLLADPEAIFEGMKCSLADKSRWRRGRGVLVLTERRLRYDEFLPDYRLDIPIKEIRAVDTSDTFLGKYRGKRILGLHFTDSNGMPADVGFSLQDPEAWALQIRKRLPA